MDPITLLIQPAFYALFGAALWRYVHHRGPVELGVVAVFATTDGRSPCIRRPRGRPRS